MDNFKISERRLLAVEGKDEVNFFNALLKHQDIKNIQVFDVGGKDKFQQRMKFLCGMEHFNTVESIGFVRDAEKNEATSAFASINEGLLNNKLLNESPKYNKKFTIATTSQPHRHVGIFIMPDNINPGMLEDLCLNSIKDLDVNNCIDDFIKCFRTQYKPTDEQKFNDSKSRVLAYLATKIPIVNSLGLAAEKQYWNLDHTCFNEIKDFLKELFPNKAEN